jgi:hypothetical protein
VLVAVKDGAGTCYGIINGDPAACGPNIPHPILVNFRVDREVCQNPSGSKRYKEKKYNPGDEGERTGSLYLESYLVIQTPSARKS